MMATYRDIPLDENTFSNRCYELKRQIVEKIIQEFKSLDDDSCMLSRDSGLQNVWEEICVQVQDQYSVHWDSYEETLVGLIENRIETLTSDDLFALWSGTDDGWDWLYDQRESSSTQNKPAIDSAAIVELIKSEILEDALNYESPSIEKFRWGDDDEWEGDEDE